MSLGVLEKAIEAEEKTYGDFLRLVKNSHGSETSFSCLFGVFFSTFCIKDLGKKKQEHREGYMALSAKTKTFFATAVSLWDAEFYIKVDDDVHVNLGKQK